MDERGREREAEREKGDSQAHTDEMSERLEDREEGR